MSNTSTNRGLIDNEKIAIKRLILIADESSRRRIEFQQAEDGLRFQRSGLGKTLCGPHGRGVEQALHFLGSKDHQDRVHEGCLTHTGAARN
jgi:hypothetical protein